MKANWKWAKFLLIGEIHGVRENVDVLKLFVKLYLAQKIKFAVAFEWPPYLSREINDYVSGKTKKLFPEKWGFVADRDGRISKEHIQFLGWLKKKKITIVCFDEDTAAWNKRDKLMARNLQKSKQNIIAMMGNLHAKKKKFILDSEKHVPLGVWLPPRQTIAIKIDYQEGKFYNHGIRAIKKTKGLASGVGLIESNEEGFDYFYGVKGAHPVQIINK